ncbi:response regulator [Rhodoblastus acidophilus]|uniref:histidine kinase n=1 Tax=Candidatus Rhodoblastus alkanivorans TaxID=2954117 RepID=A0ABS9Z4G5_9HYPH|nr:response regulator [Candidatus Rhodoblastus alkanivorans]MCI4677347.1 response regulator [Candidatus Rhodoblastus alkanivorans]MCI4682082.1 response regulator [Candidatus Rhodoblastus alkanivorans]MDI4639384.1 response regulator [Rhodoblastus acidophilus]
MKSSAASIFAAPAAIGRAARAASAGMRRGFFLAQERPEQGIMLNRLFLALVVLCAAAWQAGRGGDARLFLNAGLPGLQAYVVFIGLAQAHLALRPEPNRLRRIVAICADSAAISYGLYLGSSASAFLFPLYLWMILGNGVRLGAAYMAASVASAAIGFAATIVFTPFWRANASLSAGLFCALITMPAYGGLLLRRIAEARAEAERASRAKTLLLANVSHELRTPLTAILGLGDMLKNTRLDGQQRDMVETIRGAGGLLLRHIEGLLTVSRDEIGVEAPPPERIDLYALLMSLRAMLAVEADGKGVRLGLSIGAGAPRYILSDAGLLLDTIQNVGGNAVKFTASGAVAIHVSAREGEDGGLVLRVEARDTGIGIDKAAQDRIFETFVQGGPDIAARFGGSGLGLAIARRRLEARGGRIGVESEPGKGALFWFELAVERDDADAIARASQIMAPPLVFEDAPAFAGPQALGPVCVVAPAPFDSLALARRFALAAVAHDANNADEIATAQRIAAELRDLSGGLAEAPRDEALAATIRPRGAGRKILLAEDNGVNRMIFEAILSGGGYRVETAADGEAALDAMLNEDFDLILLDLNMPRIDGIEAARLYRLARAGENHAPILALTADASAQRREDCARAGMAACLVKPIAAEALLAALDAAWGDASWRDAGSAAAAKPPERHAKKAARAARTAATAPLDESSIKALAALGGEDFLAKVVKEFIEEGGLIAEHMAVAVERGDRHAFGRAAHALESSAGNVGAIALAGLCRAWRALGTDTFALYGDDCLEELRDTWSHAVTALEAALAARAGARSAPRRTPCGCGEAA